MLMVICFSSQAVNYSGNSANSMMYSTVSLEVFDASLQVNMGQQDLICLLKYLLTMPIELP